MKDSLRCIVRSLYVVMSALMRRPQVLVNVAERWWVVVTTAPSCFKQSLKGAEEDACALLREGYPATLS